MKSLQTQVQIEASASEVWEVLMDFNSYPQWNPFIISIEGKAEVGAKLKVNLDGMRFTPEVLVADRAKEFRWLGHLGMKGLFDGTHYFILHEQEDGSLILEHGEKFKGLLVRLILSLIGKSTQENFEKMNLALKERVEKGSKEQ